MAQMDYSGFEDLERLMKRLAEPTQMAIRAVDKAAPVLEQSLRAAIQSAADRGYATGALAASVEATKAKENEWGVYSVVKPTGLDRKGTRNVEKLAYLEYGVKSHGQSPHPVRQQAVAAAEASCVSIMEGVIREEVGE